MAARHAACSTGATFYKSASFSLTLDNDGQRHGRSIIFKGKLWNICLPRLNIVPGVRTT